MISIQNLRKTYPAGNQLYHALAGINLDISKGEIFGIIGRSGAGKSTLVRCLNLLERPSEGAIMLEDRDLMTLSQQQLNAERKNIGMIFQHFNLLESRDVFRNIAFPLEIQGNTRSAIKSRVENLLELTGLSAFSNHYPNELSGGQKQRVAIARALACNPKVLLSDEATSALDPETTTQILELLKHINRTLGLTIIIITHEMEVVRDICHQVAIIDQGRIVEQNDVISLFLRPKTDIARKFAEKTMHVALPAEISSRLYKNAYSAADLSPLVKITFLGEAANTPVIATLTRRFDVAPNTLQANIAQVHGETVGIYICQIIGSKEQWESALKYLAEQKLQIEVIGYAENDAF